METTTIELAAGPYELRASATRTLFDGFSRVYTEGRDDDAEENDEDRRLPPLAEGDATNVLDVTPTQHFTEPPPRFTEATLIKALEEHGIGRPSTYAATISTIVDRGYVVVRSGASTPRSSRTSSPTCSSSTSATTSTSRSPPGWRRSSTRSPVASGSGCRCSARSTAPLRDRVDEKRKDLKRADFTTEATDEVCSEGHPMVIRLGRNGRFLACSLFPEHKESRPLPGEEAPPQAGEGEVCPECGEGTLVGKQRPVRAVPRLLALPRLHVHQEGRTAAPGAAPVRGHLPQERRRPSRRASRPPDRQRVLGLLGLPEVRLHDELRARRGVHDADEGPVAKKGDPVICLKLRRGRPAGGGRGPRRSAAGGRPAEPRGARQAGPGRCRRGGARGTAGGTGRGRPAGSGRAGGARTAPRRTPTDRERARRVSGAAAADPALERFLRGLAARDASLHTRRSYRTAVGAYLDWLDATRRRLAATRPRTDLRAYLAHLGARGARSSTAQRLAAIRSFHRYAAREGVVGRRSVGRDRDAAPAATPAARPRGRAGRAAPRGRRRGPRRRRRRKAGAGRDSRRRWRCATGRSSRRPMPRVSGSASSPRRTSVARPQTRRDPGAGQGAQGADRAARAAGPRGAGRLPRGRPAGARSSWALASDPATPTATPRPRSS